MCLDIAINPYKGCLFEEPFDCQQRTKQQRKQVSNLELATGSTLLTNSFKKIIGKLPNACNRDSPSSLYQKNQQFSRPRTQQGSEAGIYDLNSNIIITFQKLRFSNIWLIAIHITSKTRHFS